MKTEVFACVVVALVGATGCVAEGEIGDANNPQDQDRFPPMAEAEVDAGIRTISSDRLDTAPAIMPDMTLDMTPAGEGEPVYARCASSDDCSPPASACHQVIVDDGARLSTGALCSLECLDHDDCPGVGGCYSVQGQPYLCYQRCASDGECPVQFRCTDAVGGAFDPICLPSSETGA